MYDEKGQLVWETHLDIYGKVRTFAGRSLSDCPFRYQGQYEDSETGLYYNRFRYYSPEEGMYLSQDPIGLKGGIHLYGYVENINSWVDALGLSVSIGQVGTYGDLFDMSDVGDDLEIHHIPQDKLGHLPRRDGIAIVVSKEEHAKIRTYKSKGKATAILDKDRAFKDVLKDDLVDLREIGGDKYDKSIEKIIESYEDNGKLKKGELNLDIIKKACK
jgi:RHS repeat-associated protein